MDALQINIGMEFKVKTGGQSLPLGHFGIRFPLPDCVAVYRPLVLPLVGEKAIGVDRLLVRGRGSETQKDRATRGKMLQHAIPFPEVGPMAFIEDH